MNSIKSESDEHFVGFGTNSPWTGSPDKTAITEFEYDRNGNPRSRVEYDWVNYGTPEGSTALRTTEYDYHFPEPGAGDSEYGYWRPHHSSYWADDFDPRRLNAVQRITISEAGSSPVAVTEFEYDDVYTYGDQYTTGNVIAEKHWDNQKSGSVPSLGNLSAANAQVITKTYDSLGQLTSISGAAVETQITYGNFPGTSNTGPYPTLVEYASGAPEARTFSYDWDYDSGFLAAETDEDNQTEIEYTYDQLGRILTVEEDGLRRTETTYDDDDRLVRAESDIEPSCRWSRMTQRDTPTIVLRFRISRPDSGNDKCAASSLRFRFNDSCTFME